MSDWNLEAPWIGREPEYCEKEPKEHRAKAVPITKEGAESTLEEICDNFCRWPFEYKDSDDLWNEKCDDCVVREFMEGVAKCLKQA